MKQVEKFECEYCKKLFDTQEECMQCECHHILPKTLHKISFNGKSEDGMPYDCIYPYRIVVEMNDGESITYISEKKPKTEREVKLKRACNDSINRLLSNFMNRRSTE